MTSKIKDLTASIKAGDKNSKLTRDYNDKTFFKTLGTLNDEEKSDIDDLILACLENGDRDILSTFSIPVLEKKRFVDWKNKPKLINAIVDKIVVGSEKKEARYFDFVDKFTEMLESQQLLKKHADALFEFMKMMFQGTLTSEKYTIYLLALHTSKRFPWPNEEGKTTEFVKMMVKYLTEYGELYESTFETTIQLFFMNAFYLDKNSGSLKAHMAIIDDVTKFFDFCCKQDWQCPDVPNQNNLFFSFLRIVMEYYIQLRGQTKSELVKPMYKMISNLKSCGETDLENLANRILADVANDTSLVGDDTQELLEDYLDGKMDGIGSKLKDMYLNQPEPFYPLMSRFGEQLSHPNDSNASHLLMFFIEVAKREPEKLPPNVPDHVSKLLTHQWYFSLAIMFFDALAVKNPNEVIRFEDEIIKATNRNENIAALTAGLLPKIAIDKGRKKRFMEYLAQRCRDSPGSMMIPSYVNSMRIIGTTDTEILAEHRKLFEELMQSNPSAKDICKAAIDVIEGRSLESVAQDFKGAKKELNILNERVDATEKDVEILKADVDETKDNINSLQNNLNDQSMKINELEVSVEETKVKVEEIDHKTLSHAPAWSREVSKLLNEFGERDWRLLARRLGYTNDDIINWTTQPDPCMSMLDDWFATHKTREATHGVLKVLDDMDRKDAYKIVEEAIKDAEYMVGDDEDEDDSKGPTPNVFLSYQWAHQAEVKLLKQHLNMCGYPCWMDVGQMGGGDKLFSKIDAGMRGSKVVVCCITERYAESPNCNREVNLAVNLGKPMIPLLMEKMEWPPKGGMGPIFGEFLFVRFYRRPTEGSEDDGLFWPPLMFNQLIMQIRYSAAPFTDLIAEDSPYKNWWQPQEEVIVIKKKDPSNVKDKSSATINKNEQQEIVKSPDIFISYQWDKQNEIKQLYRKLTGLNFTCWLDINMMGGGDSLYDMIDKGVRGASVILSCVTKKYAMSANCRREVTLSDAIKKPIVPLLLEKGSWPPEGPMGMILTQLVYIDFSQSEDPWSSEIKFNELLTKIKAFVQPVENPEEKQSSSSSTNKKAPFKPMLARPLKPQAPPKPATKPSPAASSLTNKYGLASTQSSINTSQTESKQSPSTSAATSASSTREKNGAIKPKPSMFKSKPFK